MKKILTAFIIATLLTLSLPSCTKSSHTDTLDKPALNANEQTSVDNTLSNNNYEEQIRYYMNLTESLQTELLLLKEEKYINECQYVLQISELEKTVEDLKIKISALKGSNDVPFNSTVSLKNDYKYIEENGQIKITGYTGKESNVIIPSNINGIPVKSIGESAFQGTAIRSVILPSTVKHIDWFAFSGCITLESITIPASVTAIEYGAFQNCSGSLKIICDKGSYAESFAQSWGIRSETN